MHSSPFFRRLAHCAPAHSSLVSGLKERDGDDADGGGAACRRAAGWQCAGHACMAGLP